LATAMSLFLPKEPDMDQVLYYEVKRDFFMPEDEPRFKLSSSSHAPNDDLLRTHPLEHSSHNIVSLEEKRLSDSEKRQANLRRNYDRVIVDRSPTVSLTALKRTGKEWHQYLDD